MSAWHTNGNRLRIVTISEAKQENPRVKTFTFEEKICLQATPGQFVMVWIPGLDEIPMSISCVSAGGVSVSVERKGQATEAFHRMRKGDLIGVRGPFGNGFSLAKQGHVMLIGGGTGLIPLTFLAEQLADVCVDLTFLTGAKTKNQLLFLDRIEAVVRKAHGRFVVTTDDGSHGLRGLVTQPAEDLLRKEEFDMVYACGPEPMLLRIFLLAEKYGVRLEVSLERLMKCAIGICGSCVLGGLRVCSDGPVFTKEQLQQVREEFGRFRLDFCGRKVRV